MKKFLSERNIAAILFILVLVVFSFAHEDSKKRQINYNSTLPILTPAHESAFFLIDENSQKVKEEFTIYSIKK